MSVYLQVAKLFSYTWTMGFFLCKSVHYLQNVSAICSVLTLTAMSIERWVQTVTLVTYLSQVLYYSLYFHTAYRMQM